MTQELVTVIDTFIRKLQKTVNLRVEVPIWPTGLARGHAAPHM